MKYDSSSDARVLHCARIVVEVVMAGLADVSSTIVNLKLRESQTTDFTYAIFFNLNVGHGGFGKTSGFTGQIGRFSFKLVDHLNGSPPFQGNCVCTWE